MKFFGKASLAAFTVAASLAMSPVEAKTLRVNVYGDPAMMDPITNSELVSGRILRNIYEGLTDRTPDGDTVPALAESWEPLDGEDGFRFHLRKNVKFHSGRTFTAKDVKYTYETLLDPTSKAGSAVSYLGDIVGAEDVKSGKTKELAGLKIVDDYTIEVRFTKPAVLFPLFPILIMDSGIVAEDGPDWMLKKSGGTGPFMFESWNRGVDVTLKANPDYWDGAPKIDAVRFVIVPHPETALAQYEAGELDVLDVEQANLRTVLRDPKFKDELQIQPRTQSRYMGMNGEVYEPFKDVRVRKAVSLAIDRDGIIKGLYDGAGFPLNGIVTPGVGGYNPDLPKLEYNPEKAKELLAEAGYPNGEGMPPVDITATAPWKDELAYYANVLGSTLGMKVNVNVMERGAFIRGMNAGELAFFPWGWTSGYPDASYYLDQMWTSTSPFNRGRWKNEKYDALVQEALATVDQEKRYALYHQAEQIFIDEMGAAPLPMVAVVALVKPYVLNTEITKYSFFDTFQKTEILDH